MKRERRLAGIVSLRDLLSLFVRSDDEIAWQVTEMLAQILPADLAAIQASVHDGIVTLSLAPDHFASGTAKGVTATGRLAMHGVSRIVTVTIHGRRAGAALHAAGSIPISFSAWNIKGPAGYGFLASLASRGTGEFLLTFRRA